MSATVQSFSFADYGGFKSGARDLVATGSTQADSLPLLHAVNHFGNTPGGTGCQLPMVTASVVTEITVINRGGNELEVYPPQGGAIETLGTNAPYTLLDGTAAQFSCFGTVMQPGMQWSAILLTELGISSLPPQNTFAQDTPPVNPQNSYFWWNSAEARLFCYYNDGTSSQWVDITNASVNPNAPGAPVGGGLYLPLAGGTMLGPLLLPATGSTVNRSEQDRAVDVANVLDFGADPTNTNDSTAAFRAAIATGKAVYFPTGRYIITDMLSLQPAQSFYGDGRNASQLLIYGTGGGKPPTSGLLFNLSAAAVIQPGATSAQPDSGAIHDFSMIFAFGDTPVRANIPQFPWAIDCTLCSRQYLYRIRVQTCNLGFKLSSGYVIDCEMFAFTMGLTADGVKDVLRIRGFHFWNFQFNSIGNPGLYAVAQDGNTICGQFGRVDGLSLDDFFTIFGHLIFTANDTTGGHMGTLAFDVCSTIQFNGTGVHYIESLAVANLGNTATAGLPAIQVNGGMVVVASLDGGMSQYMTVPGIQVTGTAELVIMGGVFNSSSTTQVGIACGGAHARLKGLRFISGGTISAPMINQTAGDIVVNDCDWGTNSVSGVAIAVNVDAPGNRIVDNNTQAYTCTFPSADPVLGIYSNIRGQSNNQLRLGGSGGTTHDGQVWFLQGSTGDMRGYAGFNGDSATIMLANTMGGGTPLVALNVANNVNGAISLQLGGTEYLRLSSAAAAGAGVGCVVGNGVYNAVFTANGGAGSGARGINIQGGGTQYWYNGASGASDWVLSRYVGGTLTDSPITVRNASGEIDLGLGNADTIVGKQAGKALTETSGFLLLPWCAGAPTGVPANAGKGIPMVFDTTDSKLWLYTGGAWKGVVVS